MSDLLSALCTTLEDHIADEEIIRSIYYDTLENADFYDGYFSHELESVSDLFKEVYEEYREKNE